VIVAEVVTGFAALDVPPVCFFNSSMVVDRVAGILSCGLDCWKIHKIDLRASTI
jgi:hypothetical protein